MSSLLAGLVYDGLHLTDATSGKKLRIMDLASRILVQNQCNNYVDVQPSYPVEESEEEEKESD